MYQQSKKVIKCLKYLLTTLFFIVILSTSNERGKCYIMIKTITLEEVFNNWIDSCQSEKTKVSYSRIVPQFFQMVFDKELKDVNVADMDSLIPSLVKTKYTNTLLDKGFKQSTVIHYLKVVGSFFNELEINRVFPDVNFKKLIHQSLNYDRLKNDKKPRARMTMGDYEACMNWILNEKKFSKRYQYKAKEYASALKFMFVTGLRVSAAFENAKWCDIKRTEDYLGQDGWTVMVVDKNNEITEKPISDEYYEELRHAMYKGNDNDLIFKDVSKQGFMNLLKEFSEETGRDLTAHSIRVGAGTRVYAMTKDLVLTQRFLGHKDPQTTIGYIRNEDRYQTGSSILSTKLNYNAIDELSHEELLEIVKSRKDIAYGVMVEINKRESKIYA